MYVRPAPGARSSASRRQVQKHISNGQQAKQDADHAIQRKKGHIHTAVIAWANHQILDEQEQSRPADPHGIQNAQPGGDTDADQRNDAGDV